SSTASGPSGSSRLTTNACSATSRTRSNKRPIAVKTTRTRPIDPAVTRRPFNFRLERVRALRERFEDQAREDLAASLSVRLKGEAMLRAASETYSRAQENRRHTAAVEVSGEDLLASQAYIERASRMREAAELELDRRDAEVDARRTALLAAARERQVLERLKERRRADHRRESDRVEAGLLDEMAITSHRRLEASL
ncbi:MAG: flagellar protein FliJ, partial [Thermoleophilaceae bacterium]|nr:flagellar protein FliJ [Thermoleophilaceae bacterium]